MTTETHVEILADGEALAHRVAELLITAAMNKEGMFAVALCGGSTPRRLYQLLGELPYRHAFPWFRTHWFWGDERFVSHQDERSNYRMVREAMLSRAPVASAYIHSIPTEELTAEAAAAKYEGELKAFYRADTLDPARPLFDVNLLGLGPDGHTASLFPGTSVLNERERWVVPVVGPNGEMRITLTYPVLESARHTVFLVAGEEKRAIFARFRQGDRTLPAANLHPSGKLWLFADAAAAGTATT